MIVLTIVLTNCATTRQISVSAKPVDRQIIQPALPREIDLKNFRALKKFKNVSVVDNVASLKKALSKLIK